MTTTSYSLYDFLTVSQRNWRNAIFIPCAPCGHPCENGQKGFLMTAEYSGHIRVAGAHRFEIVTGQKIDPAECTGELNKDTFEAAFQAHLIWAVDDPRKCTLRQMDDKAGPGY